MYLTSLELSKYACLEILFGIKTMDLDINQEAKTNIIINNFISRFMAMEANPKEMYNGILKNILNKLYKH